MAVALAGCGGGDEPVARERTKCPATPEGALRTLGEMREAARAARGPADLEAKLSELAALPADDWLTREDLLGELEVGRGCVRERGKLVDALRAPHYRHVVRRLAHAHSPRPPKLHSLKVAYDGLLQFALHQYRNALDGAASDMHSVHPPEAAHRAHDGYLAQLRSLNRHASRMQQNLDRPEKVLAMLRRLPAKARQADRAHAALMRATTR